MPNDPHQPPAYPAPQQRNTEPVRLGDAMAALHRYLLDGREVPPVTRAAAALDDKHALAAWAARHGADQWTR